MRVSSCWSASLPPSARPPACLLAPASTPVPPVSEGTRAAAWDGRTGLLACSGAAHARGPLASRPLPLSLSPSSAWLASRRSGTRREMIKQQQQQAPPAPAPAAAPPPSACEGMQRLLMAAWREWNSVILALYRAILRGGWDRKAPFVFPAGLLAAVFFFPKAFFFGFCDFWRFAVGFFFCSQRREKKRRR